MRVLKGLLLSIVIVLVVIVGSAWGLGSQLPVGHNVFTSDEVHASPEKTWALITRLDAQPTWRTGLERVEMLPPDQGKEHWREHLAHGQTMTFVVDESVPMSRRVVRLDQPGASYTGSWTYELTSTGVPGWTIVKITETGDIHPPLYRFMMTYLIGTRKNLNRYMSDLKAAAVKA